MARDVWVMLQNYDELLAYLRTQGSAFTEVRAHHAVELPTYAPPVEGTLVILWSPDPQLVQLIHPLPFAVPPERVSAVEGALLRLNHVLALPGFGYNYATAHVYFRLVLPRQPSGQIAEEDIGRAASTVMTTLRNYWVPLRSIILDGAAPETILTAAAGG